MSKLSFSIYIILFLLLLFSFLYILLPFSDPILWGIVLSIAVQPLYKFFKKKLKNESIAALIVVVIVFVTLVIPVSIIALVAAQQFILFSVKVINFIQTHKIEDIVLSIKQIPFFRDKVEELSPLLNYLQTPEFKQTLLGIVNKVLTFIGNNLRNYVYIVTNGFFNIFVLLLTLFFILRDGKILLREIRNLTPLKDEDKDAIFETMYKTVLAVIYGTAGTAVAQSVMGFIGYTLAGIEFALIWSILTFFAAFIPPFGAAFVWVPLDIYLFATKGVKEGFILLIWGTLFISTMDNIVRPLVMQQGIKLPYIALFFSTIGGLIQFGFIGVFLGPLILSTLIVVVDIYEKRVINRLGT